MLDHSKKVLNTYFNDKTYILIYNRSKKLEGIFTVGEGIFKKKKISSINDEKVFQ